MEISGRVEAGFERVADAFARNFSDYREAGAQCCVHVGGRCVVDLWGGYGEDAIQVVFSATKGATAACANLLVQRGALDPDAPVVEYWPEYGARGKQGTLVRHVLAHQAGLPAPDAPITLAEIGDWDTIVGYLAAQAPAWEPGTAYGYHAVTFGWLAGELVRRASGRTLGRFFAEELAGPAGADFWIGLPEALEPRVAPVLTHPGLALDAVADLFGPLFAPTLTLRGGIKEFGASANDRRFRAAELGGAGGVASGRGLSRLYAWLLATYTAETVARLTTCQTTGADEVLSLRGFPVEQRIGLGFALSSPFTPMGGARAFGHSGAGGSLGFADPEHGIAFGYAMTRMEADPGTDPRPNLLVKAVYDAVGAPVAFLNAPA